MQQPIRFKWFAVLSLALGLGTLSGEAAASDPVFETLEGGIKARTLLELSLIHI